MMNEEDDDDGSTLLFDMIVKNVKKRSGTACFKSNIERNKDNKKDQAPPVGSYDYNTHVLEPNVSKPDISRMAGRKAILSPDAKLRYKSVLNSFDYSSFKKDKNAGFVHDFSRSQPR